MVIVRVHVLSRKDSLKTKTTSVLAKSDNARCQI